MQKPVIAIKQEINIDLRFLKLYSISMIVGQIGIG